MGTGWDQWKAYDLTILSKMDKFAILPLEGWEQSRGIKGEVEHWLTMFANAELGWFDLKANKLFFDISVYYHVMKSMNIDPGECVVMCSADVEDPTIPGYPVWCRTHGVAFTSPDSCPKGRDAIKESGEL